MANYELGQVGLNPRDVYSSTIACEKLDCVSHEVAATLPLKTTPAFP